MRAWVVGLGTVSKWLLHALHSRERDWRRGTAAASRWWRGQRARGIRLRRRGPRYSGPARRVARGAARRRPVVDRLRRPAGDGGRRSGGGDRKPRRGWRAGLRAHARGARTRDPGGQLANVEDTTNAVAVRAAPVGTVTIVGPGAGPELAGQGVLSDLIRVAVSTAESRG